MTSKTILIADDDVNLLAALTIRLESEGFKVLRVQDAYQALEQANRHRPDLFLLDINMPAGKGFSVQERLANIDMADTPVIYMTGEQPGRVDRSAEDMGAFAVIHKPFETEELLETVRTALGYWTPAARPGSA